MPASALGQMITLAVELDSNQKYASYVWVTAHKHDTVRKILARRGHPELVAEVCRLNHIRHPGTVLHQGRRLRLPGILRQGQSISVLADDPPPIIKDGYAQYDVVARPGRKGLSRFTGYNPIVYDVAVQWEAYTTPGRDGVQIENEIRLLEEFAGRGQFHGAATGPPAVLRVSVTDNAGNVVLLMPYNYQWTAANPTAPLWRVTNLTFGASPIRIHTGRRIREQCVIELTEYTPTSVVSRSSTQRSRSRNGHKTLPAPMTPGVGGGGGGSG